MRRSEKLQFPVLALCAFLLGACNPREPAFNPVGTWQNTTHWDGNVITLTMKDDSMMLFKTEKNIEGSTRFLLAVGKWHIEDDSFLIMEPYEQGTQFEMRELFPELMQHAGDSGNVSVLNVSARLIMRDSLIYDLTPDGKAEPARTYKRIEQ